MLQEIYPRDHARFSSLPVLGPHAEQFVVWLHAQGYPRLPIRLRVRELPRVDELLRQRGARRVEDLTTSQLLRLAPKDSQDDVYLTAVVRSLAACFTTQGLLSRTEATPQEELVAMYRGQLERVRGFAASTSASHGATAAELLSSVGFDGDPARLHDVGTRQIEAFLQKTGSRLCRESLQHSVSHLRSFLRFLASRGLVARGLDATIDTPRLYRGERLPRALPWDTVRAFLAPSTARRPWGSATTRCSSSSPPTGCGPARWPRCDSTTSSGTRNGSGSRGRRRRRRSFSR